MFTYYLKKIFKKIILPIQIYLSDLFYTISFIIDPFSKNSGPVIISEEAIELLDNEEDKRKFLKLIRSKKAWCKYNHETKTFELTDVGKKIMKIT